MRKAGKNFAVWLRKEYEFPIRVPIYIKGSAKIKAFDGEFVVGTFFEPYSYLDEPYVRIATGDYLELKCEIGQYDALASILYTIAHELTHYYQWLNHIDRSTAFLERQAEQCARKVLDDYALTRETP
ncbi:MAG: hypothetical protein IJ391_03230 [Clostridia bacterium]|nr:hypothetical protein [Clostridia bacterium]